MHSHDIFVQTFRNKYVVKDQEYHKGYRKHAIQTEKAVKINIHLPKNILTKPNNQEQP